MFSRTPLLPLFAATFFGARYGGETAALLAILAAAFGAGLAVPGGSALVDEPAIILFVSGSLLVNRIVVGRNRAESALRRSEAQFRAAWDNSTFGAALLNRLGLVERINPAMERTLGYPSAAWSGVSFGYFSHPDDQAEERARFAAFMDGSDEWYHREQRYRRADGGTIWCRVTMSATHDGAGGRRTGALMVIEDVTRRRRAEDELRQWEARYRRLFAQVPVGLFQCGADGRLLSMNPALLALLGHPSVESVRGTTLADFIVERDARSAVQDALAAGRPRPGGHDGAPAEGRRPRHRHSRRASRAHRRGRHRIPGRNGSRAVTEPLQSVGQVCENHPAEPACRHQVSSTS